MSFADGKKSGAGGKRKKGLPKDEVMKDRPEVKGWRSNLKNPKMRNVKYTENENELILQAVEKFCGERNKTADELGLREESQVGNGKVWVRIGYIAEQLGMKTRSVQSMAQRYRRVSFALMGGSWSKDQLEMLADECLSKAGNPNFKPSWRDIGSKLGRSPEQCKDKWKEILGGGKSGLFSKAEHWLLRQAICEATNKLAPVCKIPWKKIARCIPSRTSEQCRRTWYYYLVPMLLQYQSKHGIAVEPEVFERLIVKMMKKAKFEDIEMVNWQDVNKFWPAHLNKRKYARLRRRLPESLDEAPFDEEVDWMYDSLGCGTNRKRDKKLLKHAELALEAEARGVSDEGEAEVDDEAEPPAAAREKEEEGQEQAVAAKRARGKRRRRAEEEEEEAKKEAKGKAKEEAAEEEAEEAAASDEEEEQDDDEGEDPKPEEELEAEGEGPAGVREEEDGSEDGRGDGQDGEGDEEEPGGSSEEGRGGKRKREEEDDDDEEEDGDEGAASDD